MMFVSVHKTHRTISSSFKYAEQKYEGNAFVFCSHFSWAELRGPWKPPISGATTICHLQCTASPSCRVDQVVDCGCAKIVGCAIVLKPTLTAQSTPATRHTCAAVLLSISSWLPRKKIVTLGKVIRKLKRFFFVLFLRYHVTTAVDLDGN